ncbi:putative mitochondrial protein [Cucumis melo var. makuwa]|uniref:Mitochondrial protein n=1 Tax=Cucumis melo var. makuwa TaxID=1194695 RepID=A0A5A7SQY5_CUCMM|nr:putative mitochondrial protein [Cucumis melo var. makuwa]
MKELGELKNFLGLEIEYSEKGLFLGQQKYVKDLLQKYGMSECKSISTPMEVEYRATTMATQENMWLKQLMKDLHQEINHATTLYCDNLSVVRLAENLVFHARTKHVEVYYHFIREKVLQEEIEMKPIKTEDQIADIFTKGLPTTKHAKFEQLGMIERSRIVSVEGEY